jgi:hypothetical protein
LRTLFVVVTLFGCWLGWNLHRVREREQVQHDIGWRGARILTPGFHNQVNQWKPKLVSKKTLPTIWAFLGAEPLGSIVLPEQEFTDDDCRRIQSLFPESEVSILKHAPGFGQGVM